MKKLFAMAVLGALLVTGISYADPVHDWHDLAAVHKQVLRSIDEMARARAANHYDMDGHGAKAEDLLKQAEVELKAAIESAKAAK